MMTLPTTLDELGSPLAIGGTAEIYDWQPGWILKLFFDRYGPNMVEYEQRIGRAICEAGLRAPKVGGIVTLEESQGLLYEKCAGQTMIEALGSTPGAIFSFGRQMAELQAEMHEQPIQADIHNLRERLVFKLNDAVKLPDDIRSTALQRLKTMPSGDRLCHGDFHPGNILLTTPKPIIIDWIDSSIGNPLADVARTSILALGYVATTEIPLVERLGIRLLHWVYLRRYFKLRPSDREEYQHWLPIIAAARLNEGVPGWDDWLVAQARKL